MHGNVMEWCYDFYDEYPKIAISVDPIGPIRGNKRVLRGGSFCDLLKVLEVHPE